MKKIIENVVASNNKEDCEDTTKKNVKNSNKINRNSSSDNLKIAGVDNKELEEVLERLRSE